MTAPHCKKKKKNQPGRENVEKIMIKIFRNFIKKKKNGNGEVFAVMEKKNPGGITWRLIINKTSIQRRGHIFKKKAGK